MKKILGILFCTVLLGTKVFAEDGIPTEKQYNFDKDNVASVLAEYIEDEKLAQKAADKYNQLSKDGGDKISAVDFVDVCVAGGIKIKAVDGSGYAKCLEMFMSLIEIQNQDIGDFNMYCPATGNALKSITDKTMIGDVCESSNIEYGFVTIKATNKGGQRQYVCTCTPKSCKENFRLDKEKYQCSNKDEKGYCLRNILGSFDYKQGSLSGTTDDWGKKQSAYYNERMSEINASTDAFNRCVQYGVKNNCAIKGALASTDVSSGFGTAKKYKVICNPLSAEVKANKEVQQEKQKKYEEELKQHKKSNLKYYSVCGADKGKTGGTERCINIFDGIEVQVAQAKNLAVEYAKEKYNDEIECDMSLRTYSTQMGGGTYGPAVDVPLKDYLKCASIKGNIFYEFEFDDAKESNVSVNKFVQLEFGRGLCLIYNGKASSNPGKLILSNVDYLTKKADFTSECTVNYGCSKLNSKLSKWGYTATNGDKNVCVIRYNNDKNEVKSSEDYYAKFDGDKLSIIYRGSVIKSWPARAGRGKKPDDPRKTVCQTPKYQACKNIGPTPVGEYWISQNEIQYLGNVTFGGYGSWQAFDMSKLKKGELLTNKDKDKTQFGTSRVLLVPAPSTNIFDREKDMYIHGGDVYGSAGCIDLANKISDFMDWFAKQTDFVSLKVVVDYGYVKEMCGESCTGAVCTQCECKKEINSTTRETNCDYL
jgi:hypothetical protein